MCKEQTAILDTDTLFRSGVALARSHARERRSACLTGSGMRQRVQARTICSAASSLSPWPTETSTGLKAVPAGSVVRSTAPHTRPEAPTSGALSPTVRSVAEAAATSALPMPSRRCSVLPTPIVGMPPSTPSWQAEPNCRRGSNAVTRVPSALGYGVLEVHGGLGRAGWSPAEARQWPGFEARVDPGRVQHAVAVDQHDVRRELGPRRAQLREQRQQVRALTEGEVAGHVLPWRGGPAQ